MCMGHVRRFELPLSSWPGVELVAVPWLALDADAELVAVVAVVVAVVDAAVPSVDVSYLRAGGVIYALLLMLSLGAETGRPTELSD